MQGPVQTPWHLQVITKPVPMLTAEEHGPPSSSIPDVCCLVVLLDRQGAEPAGDCRVRQSTAIAVAEVEHIQASPQRTFTNDVHVSLGW
jgi:hypothetical protein